MKTLNSKRLILNSFLVLSAVALIAACATRSDLNDVNAKPANPPADGKGNNDQVYYIEPDSLCEVQKKVASIPKPKSKTTVVMVSIDGYRFDYTDKFNPPTIKEIKNNGFAATSLQPSFPTLTFPNHYTLATGLRPAHHGIVGNFFYDEKAKLEYGMNNGAAVNNPFFYGGTSLWKLAEDQGLIAGTLFWVGSEAPVGGKTATYVRPYKDDLPHSERIQQVIDWLSLPEPQRPQFVTLYFSKVDSAGHSAGSGSEEVKEAVLEIDAKLKVLRDFLKSSGLDYQLVLVSDHGMLEISNFVMLGDEFNLSAFTIRERGAITYLYLDGQNDLVQETYEKLKGDSRFDVYLRAEVPASFELEPTDKIGDIVVVAQPGYYIQPYATLPGAKPPTKNLANHGWKQTHPMMHGFFYAEGSKIKAGSSLPTVDNVNVYPFVASLLGVKIPQNLDGSVCPLLSVLK